jgi:signal transduction histidine kinase
LQLAQKNEENETFVYSVSHDLRSPLVNLEGFSEELLHSARALGKLLTDDRIPADVRKEALGVMDSGMLESVGFIRAAVTRLSGIIDALLRLSRAGRVEYQVQPVDVAAVARRVADALHNTASEKQVEIRIGDLPPASGDPTAVEQVFANLVGNALNYLDPGRPGRVEVGGTRDRDTVTYFVRDNGRGILAAHLPKLFQAFQRLHPDAATGEGMGLAIVRRTLERLGGSIRAESEPGVGTTFVVKLPAPRGTP